MTLLRNVAPSPALSIRERCFVPVVLGPLADDFARRLARLTGGPLLEVAADTGLLTQAVAAALSAGLTIIATDPVAEMVAYASCKPGMARVTWQQADPQVLPFQDGTFGLVACHTEVAAFPDRVRALREIRRVTKPGGRFVFSVFGTIRGNPVADCLQDTLNALFGDDPPRFIADRLHGYADNEAIDDDLTRAGFTDAVYTTVELPLAAASASDLALGYCLGTGLRSELEARTGGDADPVLEAATLALTSRFGAGPIRSTMRALIVSAG